MTAGRPSPSSRRRQQPFLLPTPPPPSFPILLFEHALPSLLFTPLLSYYLGHRGLGTFSTRLACTLENALVYHLLLYLALALPPPELLFFAKQQRTHRRRLAGLLALAFGHAFVVAMQVTAVALMGTRMNSDFIFNLAKAVRTSAWGETDAKYFFPTVFFTQLLVALGWVGWAWHRAEARRKAHHKKDDDAASTYVKAYLRGEPSPRLLQARRVLHVLACLVFLVRPVLLRRAYSPLANTVGSLYDYKVQFRHKTSAGRHSHRRRYLQQAGGHRQNALRYFNSRKFLPPLEDTTKTNVLFILNESLGNGMVRTEEGMEAFSFFPEVVQQHPDMFDFSNARTTSANTRTAATAALTGYSVVAQDGDPEAWSFFDLPSLFTLAEAMGYRLALFAPYDTDHWWPYIELFEQRFHTIVSRSTLRARVANDCGMDDRVITEKLVRFLEQEAARGDDSRPFVAVVIWNNLHTPFLLNEQSKFLEKQYTGSPKTPETANATATWVMDGVPRRIPSGLPHEKSQLYKFKRAMGALEITDDMLRSVYSTLQSTGLLSNTLITFQADHGEGLGVVNKRLADPDSFYLSTPFWLHVPPPLLTGTEGMRRRQMLRSNAGRLVSNLDMMPTVVELLGWDSAEHLFAEVPPMFEHGVSLLQPLEASRVTAGWQGRPFVGSCAWSFGYLSNASHNLILRCEKNDVVVEALDMSDATGAKVRQRWALKELPLSEQAFWAHELRTKHRPMLEVFQSCFWDYVTL